MVCPRPILGAVLVAAPLLLLVPAGARAAPAPKITGRPAIGGTAQVGLTLTAQATWKGAADATATWTWLRCDRSSNACSAVASGTSPVYVVDAKDGGSVLRVQLRVVSPAGKSDEAISDATAPVTPAAAPAPAPAPAPPAPPGPPAFDVAAPAPPPTPPAAPAPSRPALLSPFPVVRIKGVLTARGARVTLFTVRAPRGAAIRVACRGSGCPRHRFRPAPGSGRLRPFERGLPAGTRLEVAVTMPGHVGKLTVIAIRRHAAPWRSDRCLVPGAKRPVRCSAV